MRCLRLFASDKAPLVVFYVIANMARHRPQQNHFGINRISKQYNNAPRTEYIALAVVASMLLATTFKPTKIMESVSRHRQTSSAASNRPLAPDAVAALMQGAVQGQRKAAQLNNKQHTHHASVPSELGGHHKPLKWYQRLHDRVALALRSNSTSYTEVPRMQYDGSNTRSISKDIKCNGNCTDGSLPYMVVVYNGTFFGQQWPTHQVSCAVPCIMTSNVKKYRQRADVLVFHAAEINTDNIQQFWQDPKPPHQLWALHSMESEEAYTIQQAASPIWDRIDIQATYKLSAVKPGLIHVPVPYLNSGEYKSFQTKRLTMYNKTGLALWMHNNCEAVSSRQIIIQQLMKLMHIDSPGKCLHNMDAQGLHTAAPTELMAQYKFYFVFENVFGDPDWVSSTFFRALEAGTVPVVLGAPNVLKFAPGERSIIRACDFDSPHDMVDYLMYLDRNDTAYRQYLAWKEAGPSVEFSSLMHTADMSPWCHMCTAAAAQKPWAFDQHIRTAIARHMHMKHAFDLLNAQLDRERSIPCQGKKAWWQVQLSEEEEKNLWTVNA